MLNAVKRLSSYHNRIRIFLYISNGVWSYGFRSWGDLIFKYEAVLKKAWLYPMNYTNQSLVSISDLNESGMGWPFVRGIHWSLVTKASDTELWCFLWSAPEQTVVQHSWRRWFETPSCSLWRQCNRKVDSARYSFRYAVAVSRIKSFNGLPIVYGKSTWNTGSLYTQWKGAYLKISMWDQIRRRAD